MKIMKIMKIIMIFILMLFPLIFMSTINAQTIHQQAVKMQYDQVLYPNILGWKFYVAKSADAPFSELAMIQYSSTQPAVDLAPDPTYPEYPNKRFNQRVDIPDSVVIKGMVNRLYFKATSVRADGVESAPSNVAFADIDLRPIPIPKLVCEPQ